MQAHFDEIARHYDRDFTDSNIGKFQRDRVWNFMETNVLTKKNLQILEINCGTGKDANWLANKGHHVLATDASGEMIGVAQTQYQHQCLQFQTSGFSALSNLIESNSKDLIFSNFGGLNCINSLEMTQFLESAYSILKPNGILAAVIMPKTCLWEILYYSFKNPKLAFRRSEKSSKALNFNSDLDVYYYNSLQIMGLAKGKFINSFESPVGFALPPSYLEGFFSKNKRLLSALNQIEQILNFQSLSNLSDHYFIKLTKK